MATRNVLVAHHPYIVELCWSILWSATLKVTSHKQWKSLWSVYYVTDHDLLNN